MNEFSIPVQVRWSDLDPNFHVRHSAYYDWGALCRIEFLERFGLNSTVMQDLGFGPILFREECQFRKEIKLGDKINISLLLLQSKPDYSRWSIQHQIVKSDGTVCAVITVDGAWLDISKRKLATPPEKVHEVFSTMPRSTAL